MPTYGLKIGEILLRSGLVPRADIDRALALPTKTRRRLGETLIELEVITDVDVARALAAQQRLPFLDLEQTCLVNPESLSLIPYDMIRKHSILPLDRVGDKIRVLFHDPLDVQLIDDLRFCLGCDIDIFVGARGQIRRYIEHHAPLPGATRV